MSSLYWTEQAALAESKVDLNHGCSFSGPVWPTVSRDEWGQQSVVCCGLRLLLNVWGERGWRDGPNGADRQRDEMEGPEER